MRFDQLRYFVDIAQTRSFTLTAERFFVTQQAVSKNLKLMENEVGAKLLKRTSSGVSLTAQGQVMLQFAQLVLDNFELTKAQVAAMTASEHAQPQGRLYRMGTASALNNILMPKVLNILKKTESGAAVNMLEASPAEILVRLADEQWDFGLITLNKMYLDELLDAYPANHLHCEILARDKLVACTHFSSSFAQQPAIDESQSSLLTKTIYGIIPTENAKQPALEDSIICSNDLLFHKRLLMQDDIFTLMPNLCYQHLFKEKKFIALPLEMKEPVEIVHALLYRPARSTDALEFIQLVRDCMHTL